MVDSELTRWAMGAVNRPPYPGEHAGLSYQEASRRSQAICVAAAKTGKTINATAHLVELTTTVVALQPKVA